MPYALDQLFKDLAQKRSGVSGADGPSQAEYAEVWNAYLRYLTSCLEQRRGLHLHNFSKVGWVASRARPGANPSYRPYIGFTDQFCRSCGMAPEAVRRLTKPPSGEMCPMEDFNFSKASIKFSNELTKDQVFSGLRAIVQRLGEVIGDGREVQIPFGEVGRLTCRGDREPQFSFSAQYAGDGGAARPGTGANDGGGGAAFRKEAPAAAQGLGIYAGGESPMRQGPMRQEPVHQEEPMLHRAPTPAPLNLAHSASAPGLMTPPASGAGRTPTANLTGAQFKKEVAYKEAMDRHICAMEARAAEAIAERQAWQQHQDECISQERDEIQSKRARAHMNLHHLRHQIQMDEERKREQRKEDIATASAHDFPKFGVAETSGSKDFVKNQQERMRAELDEQVRTNNTLRNLAKQRERTLELNQLQANREEMAMLRNAERAKKVYDREALATAWNSEIRMKNIWKAIDNHHKVGSANSSHAPQVLPIDGLPPPSRSGSVASAGRLMTGSSRRVPLGASSSLARLEGIR
mmetsp:Transcript_78061/g.226503  ORF Transcript_78061/g.226503 Transcript_78061/m.226503 type:complete len:521 (-) Transcript_78061:50-1612(-)